MELLILAFLILVNGVFAMSELALVTANRNRLQRFAEEGDGSAQAALRLQSEPTQFLSTIQIGITAIGVFNGIVGEAALAEPLAIWLQGFGLEAGTSSALATFLVVAIITYFTIVVGELVPKRLAQVRPESIARFMARPIAILARISHPFVSLLSFSTDTLLRLVGKGELRSVNLTEEDIHAVLAQGSAAGIIEKQEHQMVRNVFRLDDRQIGSLMTPRADIDYLDIQQPWETSLERLLESDHSRFPVCDGGLDKILGITTTKRLLKSKLRGEKAELAQDLQPAVYVPESLTGMMLLEQFRASDVQMVFVIDEYGELQGLVTVHDVLEALAGEFKTRDPEDVWAVQRDDGSWLLDGLTPIPELKDILEMKSVPEEERGRYHTLSGMLMWLFDRLPRTADVTEWEDWRFEVMDLDGNRIDKVLASRLPEPETSPDSDEERH
ncbi:HlyC/CorC family transporter [Proteobacteria bacterium 005FR1]|nr:HlyC/CorC family transporter [Proteobacteria bacterium 005FR1]